MSAAPATVAASPARLGGRRAGAVLAAAVLALAATSLFHVLRGLRFEEISRALAGTGAGMLWSCGLLTTVSFIALGGYDAIAARIVAPRRVTPLRAWAAGAAANAVSNTLGFHALTATAVRYRLLARSGLTKREIAAITALSWTALAFGFAAMFGLASLLSPGGGPEQGLCGGLLLALLGLVANWLGAGRAVSILGRAFSLPCRAVALAQMALGTVEMTAAIGALYVLMPMGAAPSFPGFCLLYIGAVLLGIVSHVPGGIGVFEAAILSLAQQGDRAGVLAALLIYRAVYNLLPFLVAVLALAGEEFRVWLNSMADSAG